MKGILAVRTLATWSLAIKSMRKISASTALATSSPGPISTSPGVQKFSSLSISSAAQSSSSLSTCRSCGADRPEGARGATRGRHADDVDAIGDGFIGSSLKTANCCWASSDLRVSRSRAVLTRGRVDWISVVIIFRSSDEVIFPFMATREAIRGSLSTSANCSDVSAIGRLSARTAVVYYSQSLTISGSKTQRERAVLTIRRSGHSAPVKRSPCTSILLFFDT